MKDQTIQVSALFIDDEDPDSSEPVEVAQKVSIQADNVRFHPVENEESTDGPSGLSISELIEEFEEEFNVQVETDFADDNHELSIVDHSFEALEDLEECVETLTSKVRDWVEGN